eukprot:g12363.t1
MQVVELSFWSTFRGVKIPLGTNRHLKTVRSCTAVGGRAMSSQNMGVASSQLADDPALAKYYSGGSAKYSSQIPKPNSYNNNAKPIWDDPSLLKYTRSSDGFANGSGQKALAVSNKLGSNPAISVKSKLSPAKAASKLFSLGKSHKENRPVEYKTPESDKQRRGFRLFGRNKKNGNDKLIGAGPGLKSDDDGIFHLTEDIFFTKCRGQDGRVMMPDRMEHEEDPVILTIWIVMTGTAQRPRTNLRMLKVFDGLPKAKGLTKAPEKQLVVENVGRVKMHFQTGGAVKKKADRFHDHLVHSISSTAHDNNDGLGGAFNPDPTNILERDFSSLMGPSDKDTSRRRAVGIQRQERDKKGQTWYQLMFADGMTAWCPEEKLLAKARGAALIAAYHSQVLGSKGLNEANIAASVKGGTDGVPAPIMYARPADTLETQRKYRRWEAYMRIHVTLERNSNLCKLVRQGIPPGLRGHVWQILTGSDKKQHAAKPGYYDALLTKAEERRKKEGQEAFEKRLRMQKSTKLTALQEIDRDIKRTFPNPKFFTPESGLPSLINVLSAYSVQNKKVGYCQSMMFVVAQLLLFMDEEPAFWMLSTIVEDLFSVECASGRKVYYYQPDLAGVQIDQAVFRFLLNEKIPAADEMFTRCCTPIEPLTINWFLCLFINSLPLETMLQVWDNIFYDGVKFLFRVGLTLFKANEKAFSKCRSMQECVSLMQNFPSQCNDPAKFFKLAFDERWLGGFDLLPSRLEGLRKQHSDAVLDSLRKSPGSSRRDGLSPHWGVASLWRVWTEQLSPEASRELDPKYSSRLALWHQLGNVMLGIEPPPADASPFDFTAQDEDDADGFVLVSPLVPTELGRNNNEELLQQGQSKQFSVELTALGEDLNRPRPDDEDEDQ